MKSALCCLFFAYAFDLGLKPVKVTTLPDGLLQREAKGQNETMRPYLLYDFPEIYEYYVNTFIGSPIQLFRLMPSFLSPDLTVIDSSCQSDCTNRVFNASESKTYQYLSSESSVLLGSDTVTMAAGLTVKKLTIARRQSTEGLLMWNADGLLVSATQSLMGNEDHSRSLVWRLFEEGKIEKPTVAVFLGKTLSVKSVLSFGESHHQEFAIGPLHRIPSEEYPYWAVQSTLHFGNENLLYSNITTFFSPEIMAIGLPEQLKSSLIGYVCPDSTLCDSSQEFTKFHCGAKERLPDLIFTINNQQFRLSEEYYVQRLGDFCWLMIFGFEDSGIFLGSPFFQAYYAEFDFEAKEIRIAKSINQKKPEAIEAQFNWWIISTVLLAVIVVVLASALLLRKKETDEQTQKFLGGLSIKV